MRVDAVPPDRSTQADGRSKTRIVLLDQAMVSGVNFATGLLLARLLGAEGYGQYVLVNGLVLFVAAIQMALIVSPMMVNGPSLSSSAAAKYYRLVLLQQLGFCALAVAAVLAILLALSALDLTLVTHGLMWSAVAALSAFICQDFIRRHSFAQDQAYRALGLDAVAYLSRLALLMLAGMMFGLTPETALLLVAGAGWLSVAFAAPALMRRVKDSIDRRDLGASLKHHWSFGKWLLGSNLASWVTSQLAFYLVAAMVSVQATGALAATLNIVAAANILFLALENLVPSRAARAYSAEGTEGLDRYLARVAVLGGSITLGLVLIAMLGAEYWLRLLYGTIYSGNGWLIYAWGLYYLLSFFQRPLTAGLRVLHDTRNIFRATAAGAACTALSTPGAIYVAGLPGAMVSLCCSQAIIVGLMLLGYRRARRDRSLSKDNFAIPAIQVLRSGTAR